jgi:hypothetical protein
MKHKVFFLFLFLFLFSFISFAQADSSSQYSFWMKERILSVFLDDNLIYQKSFLRPDGYTIDLDEDNNNEFVVIDSISIGSEFYYTLYIFNTLDSFYLCDSINSGYTKPYETASEDVEGILFAAANPEYDRFNKLNDTYYSTLNFWKFVEGNVFLVNSEVYDLFIERNNVIIEIIDNYIGTENLNCEISKEIFGAVAAVYGNYLSAGEDALAIKFLKEYYTCEDIDALANELKELVM